MNMYRRVPLSDTQNFRDLGGYAAANGVTRYGVFFRSACPDSLNENDGKIMKDLGITSVIDLRGGGNIDETLTGYTVLKGFDFFNFPLGSGEPPKLAKDVPASYLAVAESANMKEILKTMANNDGATLFHCFAGKDRTGVVAAILLMLAGVADVDIVADYTLSYAYFLSRIRIDLSRFDAERDVFKALPEHMEGFLKLFKEKYGSALAYTEKIGVQRADTEKILQKLVVNDR